MLFSLQGNPPQRISRPFACLPGKCPPQLPEPGSRSCSDCPGDFKILPLSPPQHVWHLLSATALIRELLSHRKVALPITEQGLSEWAPHKDGVEE